MANALGARVTRAIPRVVSDLVWKKEPRYDTFITAAGGAGVGVVPFFTVPRGNAGSGFAVAKTEAETNMTATGQIGEPNQFLLHGFVVDAMLIAGAAATLSVADYLAIYNSGIFRFILGGNNIQLEVPLKLIPSGVGPTGFAASSGAGTPLSQAAVTNGVPHISHYYNFTTVDKKPLLLRGSQTFRCELVYVGAGGNLITAAITRIKCYLMGVYGAQQ